MKKSTLVAMAIIALACGSMLFLFDFYTGQFRDEIVHAKEMTTEFREAVAPDTTIRLARVMGSPHYVVEDASRWGLLVDAAPSVASFATDASGLTFARPVALRLFEAYGSERPVSWIQFRLTRPDRTQLPIFGLEPLDGGGLRLVETGTAPKAPPAVAPPVVVSPPKAPAPGPPGPKSPGAPGGAVPPK